MSKFVVTSTEEVGSITFFCKEQAENFIAKDIERFNSKEECIKEIENILDKYNTNIEFITKVNVEFDEDDGWEYFRVSFNNPHEKLFIDEVED